MFLVILAISLTFVSAIGSHIFKKWSLEKANWFLSPNYSMEIEHQWYLFFAGWKLFNLLTIYGWAKTAAMVSDTLFLILVVVLGYMLIDNFMFWWDFNDDFYIYLDLFWTSIVLIRRCIKPYAKETIAKIKSLF